MVKPLFLTGLWMGKEMVKNSCQEWDSEGPPSCLMLYLLILVCNQVFLVCLAWFLIRFWAFFSPKCVSFKETHRAQVLLTSNKFISLKFGSYLLLAHSSLFPLCKREKKPQKTPRSFWVLIERVLCGADADSTCAVLWDCLCSVTWLKIYQF